MADPTLTPTPTAPVPFEQAIPAQRRIQPPALMVAALREAATLGSDNPSMPEVVFQQFIKALYDPEKDTFNRQLWLETTGDIRHGLNVMDEEGKLLFICPPPVGTAVTQIPAAGMNGMTRVVRESRDMENRTAALGQKTLSEGLARERGNVQVYDIRAAWRPVLARYGLASPPPKSAEAQAQAQAYFTDDLEEV